MRIAGTASRYLLGLIFVVFGLNGFLHFIPARPPSGVAGDFVTALVTSHYVVIVSLLEVIPGAMLLLNRYVPLALTLLGPIIVNILLFHVLMAPMGLPIALLVIVLWILVALTVRSAFAGLFQSHATV